MAVTVIPEVEGDEEELAEGWDSIDIQVIYDILLQTHGLIAQVQVRVYTGSENVYPPKYLYPCHRVWVSAGMGTGTGTAKSTHDVHQQCMQESNQRGEMEIGGWVALF